MAVGASVTVGKNTFVLSKDGVVYVPIPEGYMPRISEDLVGTAGAPELTADKMIFQKSPAAFVVVVVKDERWKPKELRVIRPTFDILAASFARVDIQLRPALWAIVKEMKDIDLDKLASEFNSIIGRVEEKLDKFGAWLDGKVTEFIPPADSKPSEPTAPSKPEAQTTVGAKPGADRRKTVSRSTHRSAHKRRTGK